MLAHPLLLLIPLILGPSLAAGLWFWLGAERAGRFVGCALPLAFLVSWGLIVRPGWLAYDPVGRIGHIVFGGLLVGLVLDLWGPRRIWFMAAGSIFLAVSAWAEVNATFWPHAMPTIGTCIALAAAIAASVGTLWRVDALRRIEQPFMASGPAAILTLTMIAFALAAVATVADDAPLCMTSLILGLSLCGLLVFASVTATECSAALLLPATAGLLAIAWAVYQRAPSAGPGVLLCGLILFADGTARRVPLPRAGISRFLYPGILVGIALIPVALATALTHILMLALRRP